MVFGNAAVVMPAASWRISSSRVSYSSLRLRLHRVAVPALERGAAVHVGGHLLVVEGEDQLVVDQHVLPARLVLELLDLRDQLVVVREERQLACPTRRRPARRG